MKKKFYGKVTYAKSESGKPRWEVEAEPHIILRMKRVFERVSKHEFGTVHLSDTHENRHELRWFLIRYPLEISSANKARLEYGTKCFEERILLLEKILGEGYVPKAFKMAIPPRDYQAQAAEIILKNGFLLVGDDVGLGKTCVAITCMTDPRALPAVVVTLAGVLPIQWEREINRFMPDLRTHVIRNGPLYELPKVDGKGPDVIIMNYHKVAKWAEVLASYVNYVVFDECHELRRTGSQRYSACEHVANSAKFRVGTSATPIFNLGGEMYNILNILQPGVFGDHSEFTREWCSGYLQDNSAPALRDPKAFGAYLRENFLMLRRTREEVKRELPPLSKIPHYIDVDPEALDKVKGSAVALAKLILSKGISGLEKMQAGEQLSWKLRQATGIAKAPYVAEFVRMLAEDGEQVLVYLWHRECYEILKTKLEDLGVVCFSGEETPNQKLESMNAFLEKKAKVMLMSLRAGQGLDGLQKVCKTVVFGEIDWSPAVHVQATGRIFRDGQVDPVVAYFLLSHEGSDPVVADKLGLKIEQSDGILDPKKDLIEELQTDPGKIMSLAKHYLEKLDIKIEEEQLKT